MLQSLKAHPVTATLAHAIGTPMVIGLAYHGSTATRLSGLDNVWGKHIDAATFEKHLRFLTTHYRVMTVSELLKALHGHQPLPRKAVFLTFDDGYAGNYDVAFPLLQKYGARASFYIATSFIETGKRYPLDVIDAALKYSRHVEFMIPDFGTVPHAITPLPCSEASAYRVREVFKTLAEQDQDDFLAALVAELGFASIDEVPPLGDHTHFLTWNQMREMQAAGMEFGSHTHNHYILARVSADVARAELRTSKALLETNLQRPCEQFCYPNGHYPADANEQTDALVAETGFACALYLTGRAVTKHTDRFHLHRRGVGIDHSVRELAAMCAALGCRIRTFRQQKQIAPGH